MTTTAVHDDHSKTGPTPTKGLNTTILATRPISPVNTPWPGVTRDPAEESENRLLRVRGSDSSETLRDKTPKPEARSVSHPRLCIRDHALGGPDMSVINNTVSWAPPQEMIGITLVMSTSPTFRRIKNPSLKTPFLRPVPPERKAPNIASFPGECPALVR